MLDLEYLGKLESSWERMKNADKPVYIYGMGDGCEKILRQCRSRGVKVSGIFASDDFVRGQDFEGFTVKRLSEAEAECDDLIVCLAFGSGLPEVMEHIEEIEKNHEVIAPDTSVAGESCFEKTYLKENVDKVKECYELLADELSRKVFENLTAYKITGRLCFLREIFTPPHKSGDIIFFGEDEVYCDLGAYNGDTVLEFALQTDGKYEKIYAVEPEKRNFQKCVKNCISLENIEFHNAAAWDRSGVKSFAGGGGRQARISLTGQKKTRTLSLDDMLSGRKCTYIKYDVEGADKEAIAGSAGTIGKYAPKLCCALYHRSYDYIELPLMIKELYGGYSFYMRQYPYYPSWETNLFAVPQK